MWLTGIKNKNLLEKGIVPLMGKVITSWKICATDRPWLIKHKKEDLHTLQYILEQKKRCGRISIKCWWQQ